MVPQERKPKRSLLIWMRLSTGFIALLAMFWRLIVWTLSILIFGIVVGVLGNFLFTFLTIGKTEFTGILTVITWLYAHFSLIISILIPILVITLCSYLAHSWRRRMTQENQHAGNEAMVAVAKGFQRALDELNAKPPPFQTSP